MTAVEGPQPAGRSRRALRGVAEFVGLAVLLFVARFIARAHLAGQTDEMCHVGGIAVDVLAHGIRFPLLVYAPSEYHNGPFFSALLTAAAFALLGRSVLVMKLVPHLITTGGALATLWLLRGVLEELGLAARRLRWLATGILVISWMCAPRLVAAVSMATVGFGNPAEGAALNALLLALYAHRPQTRSALRPAGFWVLVGVALYLNKGTLLVVPALAATELALAWPSLRRLGGALGGLLLGALPELLAARQRRGSDWSSILATLQDNSQRFPYAFVNSVVTLAEHRIALVWLWALALCGGAALFVGTRARRLDTPGTGATGAARQPVTLGLVVGVALTHVAVLSLMAMGGIDHYTVYGYPTLAVLYAALVAWMCAQATLRWGARAGAAVAAAAVLVTIALERPQVVTWGWPVVVEFAHSDATAVCSWHLAEGFDREYDYGLALPGRSREQHVIDRCRSLADGAQALDCVGGLGRAVHIYDDSQVHGDPPAELSPAEQRAFAFYYGIHRRGDPTACSDFTDPALAEQCRTAVRLECLIFGQIYARYSTGHPLGRPRCAVPEPPMGGYWAAMRMDLLSGGANGARPDLTGAVTGNLDSSCQTVFDACYGPGSE